MVKIKHTGSCFTLLCCCRLKWVPDDDVPSGNEYWCGCRTCWGSVVCSLVLSVYGSCWDPSKVITVTACWFICCCCWFNIWLFGPLVRPCPWLLPSFIICGDTSRLRIAWGGRWPWCSWDIDEFDGGLKNINKLKIF